MKRLSRSGRRFIITGLMLNAALLGVLELMVRTGLDYRIAVTAVYVLGMGWGYAQNRLWSWESRAPVFQSFTRYIIVYGVVYIAHLLFVMFLLDGLSLPPALAAIISTVALIIPIFVLLDRFVFKVRAQ